MVRADPEMNPIEIDPFADFYKRENESNSWILEACKVMITDRLWLCRLSSSDEASLLYMPYILLSYSNPIRLIRDAFKF